MALSVSFLSRVMIGVAASFIAQASPLAAQSEKRGGAGPGFAIYKTQISFAINGEVVIDGEFTLRSGEELVFRKTSRPSLAFEVTAYSNSVLDRKGLIKPLAPDEKRADDVFAFKVYRLEEKIPGAPVWTLVATPVMMVKEGEASSVRLFDAGDVINLALKYQRLDGPGFNVGLKEKGQ
jgi:hypothetical protein